MGYLGSAIAGALAVACVSGNGDYETMFKEFKASYKREYANAEEERERFEYFTANMDRAAALNRANPLARFGVNAFADRSEEEMRGVRGARQARPRRVGDSADAGGAHVSDVAKKDWRTAGAVTPVKEQGDCGSGWAFAAAGTVEAQSKFKGVPLISLSAQQSVSCDKTANGCDGGSPQGALEYILMESLSLFIASEDYPYVSQNGTVPACYLPDITNVSMAPLKSVVVVPKKEKRMAQFVSTKGPVAISVDSLHWPLYKSGVMTICAGNTMDHGALIVGFDTTATPPYWIVKNSWSTYWGEHGYIRIEMWKNLCGITDDPVMATVRG